LAEYANAERSNDIAPEQAEQEVVEDTENSEENNYTETTDNVEHGTI
jgi:hypothetical protein